MSWHWLRTDFCSLCLLLGHRGQSSLGSHRFPSGVRGTGLDWDILAAPSCSHTCGHPGVTLRRGQHLWMGSVTGQQDKHRPDQDQAGRAQGEPSKVQP